MKSCAWILGLIPLFACSLSATELFFSGLAARTLYICDDGGVFPCWFAHGSFCKLEVTQASKFSYKTRKKKKLVIRGPLAEQICRITQNDHVRESAPYQINYGNEGIRCKQSSKNFRCELEIDSFKVIH